MEKNVDEYHLFVYKDDIPFSLKSLSFKVVWYLTILNQFFTY